MGPINLQEIDSLETVTAVNENAQTHAMIVSSVVSSSMTTGVLLLSNAAALAFDGGNEDGLRSPLSMLNGLNLSKNLNIFCGGVATVGST